MKAKSTETKKHFFQIGGIDLTKRWDDENRKYKSGGIIACSTCKYSDDGFCTNSESAMFGWWINPKSSSLSGCNKYERGLTDGD